MISKSFRKWSLQCILGCLIMSWGLIVEAQLDVGAQEARCDELKDLTQSAYQMRIANDFEQAQFLCRKGLDQYKECKNTIVYQRLLLEWTEILFEFNDTDTLPGVYQGIQQESKRIGGREAQELIAKCYMRMIKIIMRSKQLDAANALVLKLEDHMDDFPELKQDPDINLAYLETKYWLKSELNLKDEATDYLRQILENLDINNLDDIQLAFDISFNAAKYYRFEKQYELALGYISELKIYLKARLSIINHRYANACSLEARILRDQNKLDEAITQIDSALLLLEKTMGKEHIAYFYRLNEKATIYMKMGRYHEAIRLNALNQQALLKHFHPFNTDLIRSIHGLSATYEKVGMIDSAMVQYQMAMRIFERQAVAFFSIMTDDARKGLIQQWEPQINAYMSFAYRHKETHPELATSAFNTHTILTGLSESWERFTRTFEADESDSLWIEKNQQKNALKNQIYELLVKSSKQDQKQLLELQKELDKVESYLSSTGLDRYREADKSIQYADIVSALDSNQVIIEIFNFNYRTEPYGKPHPSYHAFILRKGNDYPVWQEIGPESEIGWIGQKGLYDDHQIEFLQSMFAQIIEPHCLNADELFLATQGIFRGVPFSCIPDSKNEEQMLIERFSISHFHSYRDLILPSPKTTTNAQIALFGNPTYRMFEKPGDKSLAENRMFQNLQSLEGAATELRQLRRLFRKNKWKVSFWDGKKATESHFKDLGENPRFSVLHVASHGYYTPQQERDSTDQADDENQIQNIISSENPLLRSGLILDQSIKNGQSLTGESKTIREDGFLTAYEIAQMNLRGVDLAVLSACSSAEGDNQRFQGVVGLQRSFRIAGVRHLLLTNWQVADGPTAEFVMHFYNQLFTGLSLRQAFHNTQKEFRFRYPPEIWAAFSLWTDLSDFTIPAKGNTTHIPTWVYVLGTLLLATFFFIFIIRWW